MAFCHFVHLFVVHYKCKYYWILYQGLSKVLYAETAVCKSLEIFVHFFFCNVIINLENIRIVQNICYEICIILFIHLFLLSKFGGRTVMEAVQPGIHYRKGVGWTLPPSPHFGHLSCNFLSKKSSLFTLPLNCLEWVKPSKNKVGNSKFNGQGNKTPSRIKKIIHKDTQSIKYKDKNKRMPSLCGGTIK